MKQHLRFHATRDPFRPGGLELRAAVFDPAKPDTIAEVQPLVFKERSSNEAIRVDDPGMARLDADAAQSLIDELWNAGVRPSHEAQGIGQIAALRDHLGDMRRLVFHSAGLEP